MHLSVDTIHRKAKQRAHTATHLLHYLLDHLLGGTKQAGSLVDSDYLRFDFAAKEALTYSQIEDIETQLNVRIEADCGVTVTEMSREEASMLGAKAFFEDKYGDMVRVVRIETPNQSVYQGISQEFCGGTHVSSTGVIGSFKITNQEAVASGIRRIEAVTGSRVTAFAQTLEQTQRVYAGLLDCSPKQIEEKLKKLLGTLQEQQHTIDQITVQRVSLVLKGVLSQKEGILNYKVNISDHGLDEIGLKTIVPLARQLWSGNSWLLVTKDGQFALCTDATKNAKELQQTYGLKGGGDNQLIQGKDINVLTLLQ